MPSSLNKLPFQRRGIGFTPNVQERVTGQQLMPLYRCLTLEMSQFLRQEVSNPFFASFDGGIYETRIETVRIVYVIILLRFLSVSNAIVSDESSTRAWSKEYSISTCLIT